VGDAPSGQSYATAGDLTGEGAEATARRAALADRIATIGNAENESWGVELGYRYDDSEIVVGEPGAPAVDPIEYRPSTWPGSRLPHVFLSNGDSIHDRLGPYFTLLCLEEIDANVIQQAATKLKIPLEILYLMEPGLISIYERNLILVRPDQHVAWRGNALPNDIYELLSRVTGRLQ